MNPLNLPPSLNKNNAFHYPPQNFYFDFYYSLKIGTEKIQHMPTFFKYSSSFNIVFRTGRFHTGVTNYCDAKITTNFLQEGK
jgi:hypothetical protein